MTKSLLSIVLLITVSGIGYAQNNTTNNQQDNDTCARFKMRVAKPPENLDPKIVINLDINLDGAMVVNPCPTTPLTAPQLKSTVENSGQKEKAVSPSLKFKLPNSSLDSGLKSPSEVLKQFAAPTTPKPNRE